MTALPDFPLPSLATTRGIFDLSGRVALVTGGGSGLCRSIAWGFACHGADVVVVDLVADAARRCADEIAALAGRKVGAFGADVSNERDVAAAIDGALESFGKIDILLNGAGHNIRKPLLQFSQAEFDSLLNVHARGTFLLCRAVGPGMQERRSGSIINIASVTSQIGMREIAPYAAAKGAVAQLTRSLALEMAPYGVRANAIAPGFIDTPMTRQRPAETRRVIEEATPAGRFGRAEELIGPAVFLASEASSFVTGSVLTVDGGWTAQ